MRIVPVVLALALLQDPPEIAKARDKLSSAIGAHDVKAAKEAIDVLKGGHAERSAKSFLAAMQKTRDRQRSLDRSLEDDHKQVAKLEAELDGSAEAVAKARQLETVKDKQGTHHSQLLKIEDIHDALRQAVMDLGAGAFPALAEDLEKAGSWTARCEAAELIGRVDHADAAKRLLERLEKESSDLAAAAMLEALALRGGVKDDWVKPTTLRLESRSWQIRRAAARALAAGGSREAVEPLVQAIVKSDGLMRIEYDAALKKLTATELGDPGRWWDWWSLNKKAFLEGTYKPPPPKAGAAANMTRFYGLEVKSRRIAFVLDRSRTMDDPAGASGPKKVAVVRTELKNLLNAMPDGARINVIMFNDKVEVLAPAPRVLDDACRKDAARFVDGVAGRQRTSTYDALSRALGFAATQEGQGLADGIDTVYLLSDGEVNYGTVSWPSLMEKVARRVMRPLRVTVHCIAVGDTGSLLKTIAADSGGDYVQK